MKFVAPDKGRDKASTNITENFEMGIKKERKKEFVIWERLYHLN